MYLARWTHEAAREGTVPLCGDDIWNPQESLASPHSGLMKQPAKEGPFRNSRKVEMAAHEGRALPSDPCLCLGIGDGLHGMTSHFQILRF